MDLQLPPARSSSPAKNDFVQDNISLPAPPSTRQFEINVSYELSYPDNCILCSYGTCDEHGRLHFELLDSPDFHEFDISDETPTPEINLVDHDEDDNSGIDAEEDDNSVTADDEDDNSITDNAEDDDFCIFFSSTPQSSLLGIDEEGEGTEPTVYSDETLAAGLDSFDSEDEEEEEPEEKDEPEKEIV